MSIILGLGTTHLLAGVGRTIHRRAESNVDALHSLWSATTFLLLVLNWWVFYQSRTFANWSFGVFLVVVVWAILFYLMTVVLYPPDLAEGEDYGGVFERNRQWFLGLWVASSLNDMGLTADGEAWIVCHAQKLRAMAGRGDGWMGLMERP